MSYIVVQQWEGSQTSIGVSASKVECQQNISNAAQFLEISMKTESLVSRTFGGYCTGTDGIPCPLMIHRPTLSAIRSFLFLCLWDYLFICVDWNKYFTMILSIKMLFKWIKLFSKCFKVVQNSLKWFKMIQILQHSSNCPYLI